MSGMNRAYLCAATRAHADEFIDGELGPRESEGVESHLLGCPDCRAVFQREMNLKLLVRRACAGDDVPEAVRTQVLARITELRVQPGMVTFESLTVRADWRPDPGQ
jgi:mycothiol system anti-sigma-R factor